MANDLSQVAEYLVTAGVAALRQNSITARLVNMDYQTEAAAHNQFIRVPIPSAVATVTVTPGTFQAGTDLVPGGVDVQLDQWKMAGFQLSDKEESEFMLSRILPMGVDEAVKSIANTVDAYLLGKMYKKTFARVTAGNPAVLLNLTAARKALNVNLCPLGNRRMVMSPSVEEELLRISEFTNFDKTGDRLPLIEGTIGRRFGIDLYMNQNTPTHVAGNNTGGYVADGASGLGATSVLLKTGTGTLLEGDVITFAGHTQQYVVTTGIAAAGTIVIYPGLKLALSGAEAVTVVAGGEMNLIFHRDAAVLATRPMAVDSAPGVIMASATDPISGLSLRVERIRQAKQSYWQFDLIYGAKVIRPEYMVGLCD